MIEINSHRRARITLRVKAYCGYLSEAVQTLGSNAAVDIAAITFTDKCYFWVVEQLIP
jgi:hypothetical protein